MTTELYFHDKKIPVTFISSDQKAIPRLITVLESSKVHSSSVHSIARIEVVGNQAILHTTADNEKIHLALF
ncbi:hypothetical protein ACFQI7_05255 [Paenibacillus allorhizosphaerae]|uniref:Uncharacterized protein n=1 Tax=Paenibacillus allorhizosphaerae TaxID=2849866 RepID=A0ABM8VBU5_9BACL|nr:hypothetical protein [Paenibacillus allorhizosphaerae]CAG7621950.1 hypothetical protein PAECIP111802_00774 [Paenibacillus allorhizosphaerae]